MKKLKLEAGKKYRTRGGRPVLIYAIHKKNYTLPAHGVIFYEDSDASSESWQIDGSYGLKNDSLLDIVEEET